MIILRTYSDKDSDRVPRSYVPYEEQKKRRRKRKLIVRTGIGASLAGGTLYGIKGKKAPIGRGLGIATLGTAVSLGAGAVMKKRDKKRKYYDDDSVEE